jgi:hypothetical protein
MDPVIVEQLKRRLLAGDESLTYLVWLLVAFEMWREQWA